MNKRSHLKQVNKEDNIAMQDYNEMRNEAADRVTRKWNNMTNWDQLRRDSRKRWNKLTDEDMAQVKDNVDQLKTIVQDRYGITTDQAKQEVERFLERYDSKVYEMAQSLPTGVREGMTRHPWASVATALGLGFLFGFLLKPTTRHDVTEIHS